MTNRALQWSICLLHMNELPLRHLVKKTDGETSGPKGFTGPLGKMLLKADSMPIVDFAAIPSEDLCVTNEDISTDQRYLLRIYNAVKIGSVDESLAMTEPGNISHARWLTMANRFLRLYVASSEPSDELLRIVTYIMRAYVPTWFSIKREESIFKGSKHYYGLIRRCQSLDNETKEIVFPVIQNNAYFAHSECVLLTMLVDENPTLRKLACSRIQKARESANCHLLRAYQLPKVNLYAKTYADMIVWVTQYKRNQDDTGAQNETHETEYTDPPILSGFSVEEIKSMAESN